MRIRLFARLTPPFLLFPALTVVVTAWAAQSAARNAETRIETQLDAITETLTRPPSFPLSARVLQQMKGLSGTEFVWTDRTGAITATMPTAPDLSAGDLVEWDGRQFRRRTVPLSIPPNDGGTLHIFYPESVRQDAIRDAVRPIVILGVTVTLVGLGLAAGLALWLLRRLRGLVEQARRVGRGDFMPEPLPRILDELTDVRHAMNTMAARVEAAGVELRAKERLAVIGQWAGGLAHQIRNAAAGAKLAMELQKDQPDPEAFHVATSQLERIERTVKQFLELGRPLAPPKTMINLQSVLAEVVRLHAPKARHLGIRLIFQDEAKPVMIKGDAPELVHAFGNIVTNALEAAGPAGEVTIRGFFENAGSWLLEVSDNGPGLPPGLELFTPFASAKPGGIGLGLVVVKEILQAHQGTITLTRQNTLTVATVTFPM